MMEKTLENMKALKKQLKDRYDLDYIEQHFDGLLKLVAARKKYDPMFKDTVYFNKHDHQVYVFSFITGEDELEVQASMYGKYRGRDDTSDMKPLRLDDVLLLLESGRLVKLDMTPGDLERKWSELTADYYRKREAYEIKTHDEAVEKLFKEFQLE
jgi:hypothetical protein